ncbi:S8 family serine peptidase [Streptomyces sp. NPDC015032]|uniref:S8 family serine peptidase n=1 Tax=Streptomyces sp. NPDC015032 TaxID=3364937 RepID=UPI0037035540
MRRARLLAAAPTALLLTAGAVAPVSADSPAPGGPVRSAPAEPGATVRLITGDRVTVSAGPDGKQVASVQPGPGRKNIVFRTTEEDGALSVLPSDAIAPLFSGKLDRRLFDVTGLLAQGYDEAHTDALPLIVSRPHGEPLSALGSLSALNDDSAPTRRLDSINARSLHIGDKDLGRFWKQLAHGSGKSPSILDATAATVWLDGRVSPTLDRSTAQINAPAAWDAGYQGQGVKVAVLDTGADLDHPDLAGRATATKDFSGSTGTNDAFGHGTHVASTVGGTGAASDGRRKGVAPRSELMIGKVLGDDGYGSESTVIDGMEWAAAGGARVVNMSLGSDAPSDGTDPMSLAVNGLTKSSGALFVVAAGNNGEQGSQTIGSPGAADAALTVGAVDRDDSLAPFSSRGPRPTDRVAKPDVTAPGVGIVAARAAGTTMGDPVDGDYIASSGTSMATPHVAGAAALLAQQHPDWDAVRLKDALVSTAHLVSGQQVTEQGGGRVDLAAAAFGPVTATGAVALGSFVTGGTTERAGNTTVRYTNTSDSELTLGLTLRLATTGGREIAKGAVRLGTDSVRIAPSATAEVSLRVDPSLLERGDYYGYVNASTADGRTSVHTTVGLSVHGPKHRITVNVIDREGKPVDDLPTIWGADGFESYLSTSPAVAEVEEGTYQLSHSSLDNAADGQELHEVVLPEVKVTKDMSVTLDARKTTEVEIRTPRPAEQRGIISYQTYRQLDGHGLTQGTMYFDVAKRLYVSPTAKVTEGRFEFASRWQLVAPLLKAEVPGSPLAVSPYYTHNSPLFSPKGTRLTAVDAGTHSAPDLRRVRGKLAVVRSDGTDATELARAAADAGAGGLMLVHPPDSYPWSRWTPDGERLPLPTMRVSAAEGGALLERVERRRTAVAFSGTARSPYLYDVMQVSTDRVPERVVHTVSDRNSAVVESTYTESGGIPWASEQRFGSRPYQNFFWNQYSRYVPTGARRTEYVSADDTQWLHVVNDGLVFYVDTPLTVGMRDFMRTYRPGRQPAENWFGAVVRPSVPRGTTTPSVRSRDVLALRVPEFNDSHAGHWSQALTGGFGTADEGAEGDTVSVALFRDGKRIADATDAWEDFEVAPGKADYRLDLSASRVSPEWKFGTRTQTSWSFRSDTTTGKTVLPLLQLDYDVPVDAHNTVTARRGHTIGLAVRNQDGLAAPRGVSVQVAVSYDDGRTWTKEVKVRDHGRNHFTAAVGRPGRTHTDTFVTLRVTATDEAGNKVQQTVERAYMIGR